ncbi:hypothetical protein CXG81DRAFT_24912 [Caulochytrium protostelioides]|uniref:Uncharacterized protein n=1 Tax=Caulochytrium protostelioides TaxID=1555241 RepID=A0A4P9XBH2_9FUNG|nr:hypothetical protein CXG81DRAFT_24912 [Caulochytrium protostelioides]|eukprot:RKP02451.1 hypothetical protein CXG81DRAFT_24912 [Caulochytrium protostelioides]
MASTAASRQDSGPTGKGRQGKNLENALADVSASASVDASDESLHAAAPTVLSEKQNTDKGMSKPAKSAAAKGAKAKMSQKSTSATSDKAADAPQQASQPASQSASQSASQPASQSASQPASQDMKAPKSGSMKADMDETKPDMTHANSDANRDAKTDAKVCSKPAQKPEVAKHDEVPVGGMGDQKDAADTTVTDQANDQFTMLNEHTILPRASNAEPKEVPDVKDTEVAADQRSETLSEMKRAGSLTDQGNPKKPKSDSA